MKAWIRKASTPKIIQMHPKNPMRKLTVLRVQKTCCSLEFTTIPETAGITESIARLHEVDSLF